MGTLRKKYIGDRRFYRMLLTVALPIMIQNGITNLVSLLDNIMIGRVGTEQMSGVAIVNQIMFIFFLALFGGMSGPGIYTAQYYGFHDDEGIRNTFRYKLWLGVIITGAAIAIMAIFGTDLISLFLNESEGGGDLQATLRYGLDYMHLIFWGLPFILLGFAYSSTLRECGETMVPMKAGMVALLVNLSFNYLLIYGKFGFPKMGVRGAAVATDLARIVECAIIMIWAHTHSREHTYMKGLFRTLLVPISAAKRFFITGMPLLINETLWGLGVAMYVAAFARIGVTAGAAYQACNTISNIFSMLAFSVGDAALIMIGQKLGEGKTGEAYEMGKKMLLLAVSIGAVMGGVSLLLGKPILGLFNFTPAGADMAWKTFIVFACMLWLDVFNGTIVVGILLGRKVDNLRGIDANL